MPYGEGSNDKSTSLELDDPVMRQRAFAVVIPVKSSLGSTGAHPKSISKMKSKPKSKSKSRLSAVNKHHKDTVIGVPRTGFNSLPPELHLKIMKYAMNISPATLSSLARTAHSLYDLYKTNENSILRPSLTTKIPPRKMLFCIATLGMIIEAHKMATGYTSRHGRRTQTKFCKEKGCMAEIPKNKRGRCCSHYFAHESPSLYEIGEMFPLKDLPASSFTAKMPEHNPRDWSWISLSSAMRQHVWAIMCHYSKRRASPGSNSRFPVIKYSELVAPVKEKAFLLNVPLLVLKKVYSLHARLWSHVSQTSKASCSCQNCDCPREQRAEWFRSLFQLTIDSSGNALSELGKVGGDIEIRCGTIIAAMHTLANVDMYVPMKQKKKDKK